jgi:hypothetical protein
MMSEDNMWEICISVASFILINLTMLLLGALGMIVLLTVAVNRRG